jgi:hypothetical protein
LVVQDAATAGKAHFPGPSVLYPMLRAHSARQIQTRPPQALPRLRALAKLVAQGQMVDHAHSARPEGTRWLLAAAPVHCVMQARTRQMWEPLVRTHACIARQILQALPGRALPTPVFAMPAPRALPVGLAQSVQQGNTNLCLAALHVSSARPILTLQFLGLSHKEPARHVRHIRRVQRARAFYQTASASLVPRARMAVRAPHARPASTRMRAGVQGVLSAVQAPFLKRLVPCLELLAWAARSTPTPRQPAQSVLAMLDIRILQENALLARQASSRMTSGLDLA